jgi:sec-independent protein translocase protein TatA
LGQAISQGVIMNLGPREIVILLIVVLVLFGAKRLPDSARSLGRSMRIFKSEMKEMKADDVVIEENDKTEK